MPLTKLQFKPGITRDITRYSGEGLWIDGDKVRFRLGFPEKIGGWRNYAVNTYSGVARSLHQWNTLLGDRYMGVGTANNLYAEYSGTMYDITPAGYVPGIDSQVLGGGWGAGAYGRGAWGSGISSLNANQILTLWSLDNYGEMLLAAPSFQEIYAWNPEFGFGLPAAPLSADPNANMVPLAVGFMFVTDDRHVVACATNDWNSPTLNRMLVRWSGQENYLDWEPRTDSTSGSYPLGVGSTLVAAAKAKGGTLIWTDKAVYWMEFSGPPYTFSFTLVCDSVSIISQRAAVNARNSVYWMDQNNFFVFNGSVTPLPCPDLAYVFSNLNQAQRQKVFAGLNSEYNEIWWFYPSGNSVECDSVVVYNFLTNDWCAWPAGSLPRTAWVDLALDGHPVAANGGKLYQHEYGYDDDQAAMSAYIESGDTDIGDGDSFAYVRRIFPDVSISGANAATVGGFDKGGVRMQLKQRDSANVQPLTRSDVGVYPTTEWRSTRLRGRQLVFRIESDAPGVGWRLGSPRVDIQQDGRQ